jgi:predicted metalloprotease with PDZ domain
LTFPDATHRLMNVDVRFTDVPDGAFELRMSRSSPGRYALHEFAKNVFDVRITDERNTPLPVMRTDPSAWTVTDHRGTVRVSYRVFGDRVDGTYLGIDSSHAHINMPAALMWARGFDLRPVTIRFVPPSGSGWRAATQLFPGPDALTFTAPNFQYLMDSPTELSGFGLRTFTIADAPRAPTIRLAVHHTGADAELDDFARDVERIVREATAVYGELPAFDTNSYTFIAEYTPWSNGDGMEHRNSTILTSAGSIRANRLDLLDTISHEFFHAWNVERIRPRALEPFRFDEANMSGELWLAEGVTSYYGPLVLLRAGLSDLAAFTAEMASVITTVMSSPGRQVRSAEEMSRMAPFVDAAVSVDRTAFENTYISYYTWGEAIGLGLDLTLRARSSGKVTLDHFMRAMRPGMSMRLTRWPTCKLCWRRCRATAPSRTISFVDSFRVGKSWTTHACSIALDSCSAKRRPDGRLRVTCVWRRFRGACESPTTRRSIHLRITPGSTATTSSCRSLAPRCPASPISNASSVRVNRVMTSRSCFSGAASA